MGKVYFITYGDTNYQESLDRIRQEAEALHLFDEIRIYTDAQLPEPFGGYARRYKRGGGYWLWKPWVVHQTLEQAEEGDVIVYSDAGCTLLAHRDWQRYFHRLEKKEALFFIAEGKNKKWCKKELFHYFTPKNSLWKHARQIQATFFMVKKDCGNVVMRRWYELAMYRHELFIDVPDDQKYLESSSFREHRHDQSVLTACVCTAPSLKRFCFLPEKMERRYAGGQALLASRISGHDRRGVQSDSVPQGVLTSFVNLYVVKALQKQVTLFLFRLTRMLNR